MILRGIVGLALLPVLVSLYVAGAVMGLLWIGVAAGWHSAGEVIDWIVGDTHTWKVTIQRVRLVPDSPTPPDPGHGREGELPANPEAMRDPARGLDAAIDAHLRESDKRAVADG